jgi:hypothetical protein
VNLNSGRSRASLTLASLDPTGTNPAPLDEPVQLQWDEDSVTVRAAGRSQQAARARAREHGGLLGRYPDEIDALDDLLEDALRPRLLGDEDGQAHYGFEIDSRKGGRRGFPAELSRAFAQGSGGMELELEAWIGADGLPHRLDYVVLLDPVHHDGKLVLPARTVRVSYDLSAFGEPLGPDG